MYLKSFDVAVLQDVIGEDIKLMLFADDAGR